MYFTFKCILAMKLRSWRLNFWFFRSCWTALRITDFRSDFSTSFLAIKTVELWRLIYSTVVDILVTSRCTRQSRAWTSRPPHNLVFLSQDRVRSLHDSCNSQAFKAAQLIQALLLDLKQRKNVEEECVCVCVWERECVCVLCKFIERARMWEN